MLPGCSSDIMPRYQFQIDNDEYAGKCVIHRVTGERALVTHLCYVGGKGELRIAAMRDKKLIYEVWSKHEVVVDNAQSDSR